MAKYSKRQWITFALLVVAQFFGAACYSIQAPFYPAEAESKGAKPSQYGFVFGISELAIFICSPFFGAHIDYLGTKFVTSIGMFVVSISFIAFGFLDKIQNLIVFLSLSFAIRIIEGIATAAYSVAIFSIVAKEFTDCIGVTFAILEGFFGVGLITGPTIGGALYEIGGFVLPFITIGSLALVATVCIVILLPADYHGEDSVSQDSKGMFSLIKNSTIILGFMSIVTATYAIGFIQATLEPHVRSLNLTPLQVGALFIVNGITYALTTPIWGRVVDKCLQPRLVQAMGSFLLAVSFSLIGPAPYFPMEMSLPLVITALVFQGLAMGAINISSFSGFHQDSLALGYPDDVSTHGLISGLWTAAFAFGAFIGPSVAGILFDAVGFRWSTQTVVLFNLMLCISALLLVYSRKKRRSTDGYLVIGEENSYGSINGH